MQRLE